jgi:hypothetical protein
MEMGAQSRHGNWRRRAISVGCALALLALPLPALADAPANDQYTPPPVSATGQGPNHDHRASDGRTPDAKAVGAARTSSSSSAVPIFLGGLGAAAAAAGVIYVRRRNADRKIT